MGETQFRPVGLGILRTNRLAIIGCAAIVLLLTIWPADAPWGGDDVSLITTAIRANGQHRLVEAGLGGSFGYPYGPIPSQIYQLLTMFSHHPVVLVQLHAGLFAAATAFSLLYLAGVLNVSPWFAAMTMLGPFFWFYTRLMWDNTFAIPVGTLLLASYGDYLQRPSRAGFFTFVSCGIALPFIHPMTMPLATAVGGHALYFQRPEIKKHWPGLIVIVVIAAISCGPYVKRVVTQIAQTSGVLESPTDGLSRAAALAFPLLSGRVFCAYGFFDARGPEIGLESAKVVMFARAISTVAYLLFWIGLLIAVIHIRRARSLLAICVIALFLQSLMDGRLRISPYPHYYCGTWAAIVVLIWTGLDSLKKIKLRTTVIVMYASSLIIATGAFALDIHRHSGGRIWYGPALRSQILAASQISQFPSPVITIHIDGQSDNPAGIKSLIRPQVAVDPGSKTNLIVRYTKTDGLDCHLDVVKANSPAD